MNKYIPDLLRRVQTPFYVLDEEILRARVQTLQNAARGAAGLVYAVKANAFISPLISDLVSRYEVCSPGELSICQKQGLSDHSLVISGVYKSPDVMEELIASQSGCPEKDCCFTAESASQLNLLSALSRKQQKRIRLLVRISNGSQFGIDPEEALSLMAGLPKEPFIEFAGIQYFTGTQKSSLKKLERELSFLSAYTGRMQAELGLVPSEIEYGPGFPVFYFAGEDFDEKAFLASFFDLLQAARLPGKIYLELGRSIAASCGSYYTRVADLKINKKERYAILDGGSHQVVYYGQFMAVKHPPMEHIPAGLFDPEAKEERSGDTQNWNLCGALCTTNDILVKQVPFTDLRSGDVIAFYKTGAYALTEGMALFLSRELPEVLLLKKDGSAKCLRPRTQTAPFNGA